MTEKRYTIRWYATGDVEQNLTIDEVWSEASKNGCILMGGLIVKQPDDKTGCIVAAVTKEDS